MKIQNGINEDLLQHFQCCVNNNRKNKEKYDESGWNYFAYIPSLLTEFVENEMERLNSKFNSKLEELL